MVGVSVVQVGSAIRHTPLAPLSHETEPMLNYEDPNKNLRNGNFQFPVLGGFVGGGQLAWRAYGPTVEVIEPSTGTRKAAWTFGAILHNAGARVTTVCGVGPGTISQVIVGVDLGADRKPQGMVALLCLYSSRLTRVFHFTHKVTSLCMVSGGEISVDPGTLAPELRPWHGLLVVGTAHGALHLLDLALDIGGHKVLSDEVSPGNLISVATPDPQAEHTRISAVMQHCHPTMCLSDSMSYGGRFHLIGPDDNILFETSSHLVTTTALAFIPQLASLIVGYNFGAFQIINLSSLTIDCTSPYEDKMPPVYSFACQEPENDPKNFVYLWLCRSWGPADGGRDSRAKKENNAHALCTMYAMNYDNKVWIEGHGLWYQGLASISPRFEFDAIGGLGLKGQPAKPSVVFAAMTVRQTTPNSAATPGGSSSVSALATPDEDSGPVPEQSLCLFGWVGGILENGRISVNHYLAVFDINQWYQAQMPSSMKLEESHLCPYMSFHELDKVPGGNMGEGLSEVVLGAGPKPASWARHMSRTCNDSDWFPAALSYDAHVLTTEGLMEYRCQSAQQAALTHLTSCGPSAIVSPEDAYAMCVFAGLIPPDAHPNTTGSYMVIEREALLNVALDQQLVSLLVQCVSEFSEGRFTNLGCSLPSLLEWSWSRVCAIKTTNDNLSLPLFDPDCGVMSTESIAILHQNLTSLASLTTIITAIRDYASTNMITLKGAGELENRVQVVGLLMLHLSVVLWFYHCGLLSHTPTEDVIEDCHVPFPADLLCRIYKNRRSEVQRLSSALVGNEVLMIDGLLANTGDSCESIGKAWEKEGGSGMYPPPSLHALLAIFLLPDVSTTTKHRIVQYLFLDLASLLSDGYVRVVEELVKYPSSFSLSPSHIKLTQAFWLLDHKDFQEGLNVLLDPLVNTNDITSWQHRRIMKAFLYQGEHARALTYAQIRQPPKVDLDDVRLHLTLLLANGLIREAFHYQRSHRNKNNSEDLLNHLFTGCEQLGKLECVVHLPLSPFEEEALVSYLHASSNPSAHDYLLVYYLQRARYDDAAVLQDSLRGGVGTAKKRQGARSALVHGYLTHLPDVAKRLTSGVIRKNGPTHSMYTKPQPLSAQIRQAMFSPVSRAGGINRMLKQSQEAWPSKGGSTTPYTPFRNKSQRRKALEPVVSEDFGGLFTPKTKNLTSGETSHVVFPSRVQASYSKCTEEEDGEVGLFSPSSKRIRLGESSHMRDDVSKLMESVLRRSVYGGIDANTSVSRNMSSDLMSLLQTPKIMRKRKSGALPSTESSLVDTPQSILKVRQMVQRPLSPSPASETSIPVFPRLSNKRASISTTEDLQQSRASDTSMTPKQLRFHLPKMRMDEDPVINEQEDKEEDMLDDDHSVSEEVVSENVEEEIVIEDEDNQELEDDIRGIEEENEKEKSETKESEVVQDIDGSEEECGQELEDEGATELEEEEKEIEGDLEPKAVIIPSSLDTNNLSENPLKNPDSGIPTPRQPLHGRVAIRASVAAVLHKSDIEECIDEVDSEEAQEEDQEESLECVSRDTTINEIYYSFEEPSKVGDSSEEEELDGAERSKEVGDTDDENVKGENEIINVDEYCPEEDQDDKIKSQKGDDLLYEALYDEDKTTDEFNHETGKDKDNGGSEEVEMAETTNAVNQEMEKGMDEEGSEGAEEIDITNAISQVTEKDMDEGVCEKVENTNENNQEAENVFESTSLLKGQVLDSSSDKVDNISYSEDSVEETEHAVEEVIDVISNSGDNETERSSEDELKLSLNDSEVIETLEFSEDEELEVKEKLLTKEEDTEKIEKKMKENISGSPVGKTEEKCEDNLKLTLNESEFINPLEFSDSESEPDESSSVEDNLTFKETKDHAREEKDANDEQQPTKNQQSDAEEEELATIEKEWPTTEELEPLTKDKVTTKEQQLATKELQSMTKEDLGRERETVIMKDAPFTEESSATVEQQLQIFGEQQCPSAIDDHNKEKKMLVEKTENFTTDLSENNQELITEADCQITEEDQEMITEAMSEEEGICLTLETPEHFSPLLFSDSENEDEDIQEENPEEKDRLENEVDHSSSSETNSLPTKVTLPINENQNIKMPESSIFEKKIMKVNTSEVQSNEASISEGRGDAAVSKMEHEATVQVGETPAAVVPAENSRVMKTEEVLISSSEQHGNQTFGFVMTNSTKVITTAVNKEYSSNLSDQRVESSVTEEELSKPSIPKDTEAYRLGHEIQAKEDLTLVSSEEMLPLEDQTKSLGNEDIHEKLCIDKNNDKVLLRNYDERGILERKDTEIVPKNQGPDKESLESHKESIGSKTEIENADLGERVFEYEGQTISKTSSKDEKKENVSFKSESVEQGASALPKEQKDELTGTLQEKSATSTSVSEENASVLPRNTGWRESTGTPTEVSEEMPLSISPRDRQVDSVETAATVIEEIGLIVSSKRLEYADFDIPTETTKGIIPTGSLTKVNEGATVTVSARSSRRTSSATSFTAAMEEIGVSVSPRKSEQSDVTDRGSSKLSGAKDTHAIAAETTETTTTASPRKISKGDFVNTDTKTSPVKNLRHTTDLQTTSEDTTKELDNPKTTPLRRSQRIRASSPYTPGTPKTRKSINTTEATTPVRASSQESGDEKIIRSGRKIHHVATPITKSKKSVPGSPLVTPRKSARYSDITEEMQKISQKLELSSGISRHDVLTTPPVSPSHQKQHTNVTAETKVLVTPSKLSKRRSTRHSISDEGLETIKEEREKTLSPKSSESEGNDALNVTTTKTPTKMTPSKLSSTKSTPRRRSSRQSIVSEGLETIAEDAETPSTGNQVFIEEQQTLTPHRTRHSVAMEAGADLQRSKTPRRTTRQSLGGASAKTPEKTTPQRRRRSVAGDNAETPERKTPRKRQQSVAETPERKTPLRRRRSVADDAAETPEKKTPLRGRRSVAGDAAETPEKETPRRGRRSVAEDAAETPGKKTPRRGRRSVAKDVSETPERKTPRRKGHSFTNDVTKEEDSLDSVFHAVEEETSSSPLPASDVRRSARRQRNQSQSEDSKPEVEESEISALKINLLPSLEVLKSTPDRRTSRSSTMTSMKDSESSENENKVQKKRLSKRLSGGSAMPRIPVEEQDKIRRKSRRLTLSSTLSVAGELQQQEPAEKPSQKRMRSLKIHSESDETVSLLTPDTDLKGHFRKYRKSNVASKSILLIGSPSEDEDLELEQGLDSSRDADDEAKYVEVQESPDLSLNLIEVVGQGKKKGKGSLSHLSVGKRGRRKTIVPRRSLQSLKLHTESSQDQEDVIQTKARRSQKYKRRTSKKSASGIQTEEKNEEVEIITPEKKEEEEIENVSKEGEGKGATALVTDGKECKDMNLEKELVMVEAESAVEQKAEEITSESLTPQFEFAKPKSVTSSRRVRALEYLTSEAVEFLFSPPQAAGRIVRHHAKVEEGSKTSSSESETESEKAKAFVKKSRYGQSPTEN